MAHDMNERHATALAMKGKLTQAIADVARQEGPTPGADGVQRVATRVQSEATVDPKSGEIVVVVTTTVRVQGSPPAAKPIPEPSVN
jgi:hypothetical protein